MSISNFLKKLNHRDNKFYLKFSKTSKIIFSCLIIFSLIFLVRNILAADNLIKDVQDAQVKKNNAESWQENAWNTTAVNVLTTITGKINFDANGNIISLKPNGLIHSANNLIGSAYKQPQASGVQYIAQVKNNFLGKQSYAQGVNIGNNGKSLQPLLKLWKTARDMIYGIFSLIFVIIGIMIMLRIKISPQVVISIQNATPKLIIALIMVTFSYAISGFIIDLSYLVQGLGISFFFKAEGKNLTDQLMTGFTTVTSMDTSFDGFNTLNFTRLQQLVQGILPYKSTMGLMVSIGEVAFGAFLGGVVPMLLNGWLGEILRWTGEGIGAIVGMGVGAVIMLIVMGFLIAWWLIKLWWGLLKAYVLIIVDIITAPFVIAMGAFPNSKIGFNSWLIRLISQVAVFPITLIAIVFIYYLSHLANTCKLWAPRLIDLDLGTCNGGMFGASIAFSGLALLSKLPKLIPEAIFKLKPSGFGSAIGENFKPVSAFASGRTAKAAASSGINKLNTWANTPKDGVLRGPGGKEAKWRKGVDWVAKAADKIGKTR